MSRQEVTSSLKPCRRVSPASIRASSDHSMVQRHRRPGKHYVDMFCTCAEVSGMLDVQL